MTAERFQVLEKESRVLKIIAEQYAPGSTEYLALEHAAFALAFALTEDFEKFTSFIRSCRSDLTDQQKAYLKEMGLEPE